MCSIQKNKVDLDQLLLCRNVGLNIHANQIQRGFFGQNLNHLQYLIFKNGTLEFVNPKNGSNAFDICQITDFLN